MKSQTITLRIIGAAGALLFGFFFLLTFWRPMWVRTFAADFIKNQVTREVDTRIDKVGFEGASQTLAKVAAAIYRANQQKIDAYKADLKNRANEKLAECIARMLALDEKARARIVKFFDAGDADGIAALAAIDTHLTDFLEGRYLRVVGELKRDLRIFTASNFCGFALLLLATFLRPQAMKQLFVPGLLLAAATLFCAYTYVFDQNWLLTIIYGNYLGFAYLGYLALAFAFLCDILLNYGRVTAALLAAALGIYAGPTLSRRRDRTS